MLHGRTGGRDGRYAMRVFTDVSARLEDEMNRSAIDDLPIAGIGAGPAGLAAAAHLLGRGLRPIVFEKGAQAGSAVAEWAHVRMFSPWEFNTSRSVRSWQSSRATMWRHERCA